MNEDAPRIELTLDRSAVGNPMRRSVRIAGQVIAISTPAIAAHDFQHPLEIGPALARVQLHPPAEAGREGAELTAWLLAQSFGELARGIRQSLEGAHLYSELVRAAGQKVNLDELVSGARRDANRWPNPTLMREVSERLSEPLAFAAELTSFQRIRNCLEHRAGVVSAHDLDPDADTITLTFPRLALKRRAGDELLDLEVGVPLPEGGPHEIVLQRVSRTHAYRLGERIAFTEDQIGEALVGCLMFADDLVARLPALKA